MGKLFPKRTGGGRTQSQTQDQSQCQEQEIKQRRDESLEECSEDLEQGGGC